MTKPTVIDGVPEEFLDAAVDVGWGMGFSHLRRVIAAVMPLHEGMVRAKVSAEILAARDSLPAVTIDDRIYRTAMVLAARVATSGPTRAPQATGGAHTPERRHGEGPDEGKPSQRRSEAQDEEARP